MIESYSFYDFEIIKEQDKPQWHYVIYDADYKPSPKTIIRESEEWYESEQRARFASIGHIMLLEGGEG